MRHLYATILLFTTLLAGIAFPAQAESGLKADTVHFPWDMLRFTRAAYRHCPVPVRVQVI
ncbi:TPA: hypothetical protein SB638_005385 [Escherichia coli]|nr:hypothetical protein [Escherichia coli]